jgi:hypothetical protein
MQNPYPYEVLTQPATHRLNHGRYNLSQIDLINTDGEEERCIQCFSGET